MSADEERSIAEQFAAEGERRAYCKGMYRSMQIMAAAFHQYGHKKQAAHEDPRVVEGIWAAMNLANNTAIEFGQHFAIELGAEPPQPESRTNDD